MSTVDMSKLIAQAERFTGNGRINTMLTSEQIGSPFNEELGDVRANMKFFLKMCVACKENKDLLGDKQFVSLQTLENHSLKTYSAPKRLHEMFGSSEIKESLQVRIFSESGANFILASYVASDNDGVLVPIAINDVCQVKKFYHVADGKDTYRLEAKDETDAIRAYEEKVPKERQNLKEVEVLFADKQRVEIQDPSGPFKLKIFDEGGDVKGTYDVRTMGRLVEMIGKVGTCKIYDNSQKEIFSIQREVPVKQEGLSQSPTPPNFSNLNNILQMAADAGRAVVLIHQKESLSVYGSIRENVLHPGSWVFVDNSNFLKVEDIVENAILCSEHLVDDIDMTTQGKAIHVEIKQPKKLIEFHDVFSLNSLRENIQICKSEESNAK